jgi:hypothetical protein
MATPQSEVEILATQEYKYGFVTDIEQERRRHPSYLSQEA